MPTITELKQAASAAEYAMREVRAAKQKAIDARVAAFKQIVKAEAAAEFNEKIASAEREFVAAWISEGEDPNKPAVKP